MKTLPFTRTAVASAIATAFIYSAPLAATPVSGEFRVNTFTTASQFNSSVAVDADGDFVVAWESYQDVNNEGVISSPGVYAQRYNAAGVAQGREFRVNTFTINRQTNPSVAIDADGDFVVTWQSYTQDGSDEGVFAQRYNAAGVAQGSEFRVNTFTSGNQFNPSIALDADGDFVVAWQSDLQDGSNFGIYAQRYNAAGVAQGGEFRVNTFTSDRQADPSVAIDADGDFVVTWNSVFQDGSLYGIYAQRYNAAGIAQGGEFQVNTFTTNRQSDPDVALDTNGDFVVVWQSTAQVGSFGDIYAQRYNAAGVAQDGEFLVNTNTQNVQSRPSVAVDADGDFVVAWDSYSQNSYRFDTYAQRYNAAGVAQGGEFQVNTFTDNYQNSPSVAIDADGDFVIAWESTFQDGSGAGIYARRYRGPDPIDLTLTQSDSADPVVQGAPLSYSLRISNLNTPGGLTGIAAIDTAIGAAGAVRVTSTLPVGSSFVSASGTGWSCGSPSTTLTCRLGSTLAAGTESNLILNLLAPNAPGTIENAARVEASQLDRNADNNRDTETTQVGLPASPMIQTNVSSFDFRNVAVGASSPDRTLVVTSSGAAPLEISSIRVSGDYSGSSTCPIRPATLAPGATCTLTGRFRPTATGSRPGNVTINSNAPTSPTVVQLIGNGT